MLSNLEKHYEGYNRSVKTLMEHVSYGKVDNIKGGCEVLGDIIKVKRTRNSNGNSSRGSYI